MVPYANREGRLGLWPVLLEDQSGEINAYSKSAISRIAQGAGKWCTYEASKVKQAYRLFVAEEQQEPPTWPEGLAQLVKAAFEDRLIADPRHEVLRRLRGKEVG